MRHVDADSLISLVQDATILSNGFKQVFVAIVNGEPTIEPERKKGEWVNDKHAMPRCSCCGYMPEYNRYIDDYYYSDWCPNCGADMRGGQE